MLLPQSARFGPYHALILWLSRVQKPIQVEVAVHGGGQGAECNIGTYFKGMQFHINQSSAGTSEQWPEVPII